MKRMKDSVIAELAIKAQQGDMKAFEELYTEFSPLVYSILYEITHDPHEAEDLTQDCFVSALKNIHALKEPAKVKKWLTAIAANHGKDYLKKKKPALLSAEYEYIFEIQEEKNESLLPEESVVLDERSEEIREIVNSVSEDKRLCLVLFYQHEMSISEISKELGISESAVKSRLFRAREDIREEVEKRNKKGMPLFGIAPLPLILYSLQKSSQTASLSFAGSAAQTAAFAGVTAVSQAVTSAGGVAATGVGAKVAAMSVAQKVVAGITAATVVTGSAAVTTVVVKNKIEVNETTTAYVEEVTTSSDYNFENNTVFIPIIAESESSLSVIYTGKDVTENSSQPITAANSTTTVRTTLTEKSTSSSKTTTAKQTTKVQTTAKATVATTKAMITTTKAATTTTKAATTVKSNSPATVTVTLHTEGSEATTTKTLMFEVGETISDSIIEQRLMSDFGIDAMSDSISATAESGKNYSVDAFIIS